MNKWGINKVAHGDIRLSEGKSEMRGRGTVGGFERFV